MLFIPYLYSLFPNSKLLRLKSATWGSRPLIQVASLWPDVVAHSVYNRSNLAHSRADLKGTLLVWVEDVLFHRMCRLYFPDFIIFTNPKSFSKINASRWIKCRSTAPAELLLEPRFSNVSNFHILYIIQDCN